MDSICRKERLTQQLARSAPAVARVWAVYLQQSMKSCLKRWVTAVWDLRPLHTALMHSSMDPVQQSPLAACTDADFLELIASVPSGGRWAATLPCSEWLCCHWQPPWTLYCAACKMSRIHVTCIGWSLRAFLPHGDMSFAETYSSPAERDELLGRSA